MVVVAVATIAAVTVAVAGVAAAAGVVCPTTFGGHLAAAASDFRH